MSLKVKLIAVVIPALGLLSGCAATEQMADRMPVTPDSDVASADVAATDVSTPPEKVVPPDQVDIAWEDNGTPIRPLSSPGKERKMEQPVTAGHYRGALSVAPPVNASSVGDKKNPKKK